MGLFLLFVAVVVVLVVPVVPVVVVGLTRLEYISNARKRKTAPYLHLRRQPTRLVGKA